MSRVPYVLNRYVGPFFMGVLMAAAASSGDAVSAAALFVLAVLAGFLSLPGKDRLIARLLGPIT